MRVIKGLKSKNPTYVTGTPRFLSKQMEGFILFRRVGPNTAENYRSTLLRLLQRLQNVDVPINENHINKYVIALKSELSESSMVCQVGQIRNFFKYLNDHEIYENKIYERVLPETAKNTQGKFNIVTKEQFHQLLEIQPDNLTGLRNKAIFRLLQSTGIRIGELMQLNVGSFYHKNVTNPETFKTEKIYFVKFNQKGGYHTERKIFPETFDAIREYLTTRGNYKKTSPLFISHHHAYYGKRISRSGVQQEVVKSAFTKIGLPGKGYSAHSFRTTLACMIYSKTNNAQAAGDHLGHLSPETIKIYIAQIRAEQIGLNQQNYEY